MTSYEVHPIGNILNTENGTFVQLEPHYIPALQALEGFSHINLLWWCSGFDDAQSRSILDVDRPYKKSPEKMGIFATRSPIRPNPIALTPVEILEIDHANGRIQIAYVDAYDDTPVLDIKPYTPSFDRVQTADVPAWCSHWPKSLEESADFAWEKEFNF